MKNLPWRHCLLLACILWSGNNQASTISVSGSQDLIAGPVLIGKPSQEITAGRLLLPVDIVALPGGNIQLEAPQPITNIGSLPSPTVLPLPSEPTFWALHWTSGITHIGDYFDIEVVALSPLANASPDELVLGFGFNTQLGGTAEAQFLGSSINSGFTDLSTQEGLNLAAAGLAFPGLSSNEAGAFISLAVLHFQAVTAGNLNIAITSDLSDPNQGLIFLTQAPLAIQANNSLAITAVPLPPALLFFISGLIMSLGGIRKRIG